MEILKQNQYDTYPVDRQIVELFAAKHKYLEEIPLAKVKDSLNKLYSHLSSSHKEILKEIMEQRIISEDLEKKMHEVFKKFFSSLK